MQQVMQSLKDGNIILEKMPLPQLSKNHVLIQTHNSLISSGTERMLLNFGKASLFGKIKQQPEKVKAVFEKIKTDGLLTTLDTVRNTLEQKIPVGYSNVGHILDLCDDVKEFNVGDRVVSNGPHASVVRVSKNLCAKIPDNVSDEEAVFTVLSAIALQGIRLSQATLGESFVVIGLGAIGLIAVQLLRAHGCRVLGVDFDSHKLALAKQFGAECVDLSAGEDLIQKADYFSRGSGVDGVIITASAKEDSIVHQAATISRKRGRIILVGVVDLHLQRADFYEKELSFQVSCSYGPGRYDENYENKGHDYPIAFVRWTEQRNFEAVLDMLSSGQLNVKPLISAYFPIESAQQAYDALSNKNNVGLVFQYPKKNVEEFSKTINLMPEKTTVAEKVVVAFVGAGNYASRMLMPAFKKTKNVLHTVVTNQGASAVIHGKKNGFQKASTDISSVLENRNINIMVIVTQHHMHANQTIAALKAGKHVFVEKPLCLTLDELAEIKTTYQQCASQLLMVGFNRRFSPYIQKIKSLISPLKLPLNMVMTINAGFIPKTHWTQDSQIGGGRLIGEACHFIDLFRYLVNSKIIDFTIMGLSNLSGNAPIDENVTIVLKFSNGSCGTIHYFSNGHKGVPKERLEIFVGNKILQLNNFKKLIAHGFGLFKKMRTLRQDKGQDYCVNAFVNAITQGVGSPISADELFEVAEVCIKLRNQLSAQA